MAAHIHHAIVRPPAANFADGLTTASLGQPSFAKALEQHAAYCRALRAADVSVTVLEPEARYPDGVFVEDTAVLGATRAMLTRPGAASRLGEAALMRESLGRFFDTIEEIAAPGTLDGGDVCEAGDQVFIGISNRTNLTGAIQLGDFFHKDGKAATLIDISDVGSILHLKSGMSFIGDGRFVAIDSLVSRIGAPAGHILRAKPSEAYGANCIRVNDVVLIPAGHPFLQETLTQAGYSTAALDVSEFRKMDGGLSCLSLRF